jgi:hypothetical protein
MGERSDDVLDGFMCQDCGTYFNDGCGYPRSCAACIDTPDDPRRDSE